MKFYMWNEITYEIFNSYMKFYMWKKITYEILNSYVKIYIVKSNHIWISWFINEIYVWNITYWTSNSSMHVEPSIM